ncbi:DUF1236 domain-containing protein [Chelatococcus sp. SYSU_G07232]|uniref:DUF1236 domain-containing protein n=1 Tax=Chelatococcus albus TaxID=3047466 RepID=A0ABT7AJE0_9HYPH|nr:DUF1236 domain-containing protein [Chelatococcus sp. SYSU_G07232]MDJ1158934.1 DUF1236 domain-containing protein [Chelatococcus sp. SYSU_G07232]
MRRYVVEEHADAGESAGIVRHGSIVPDYIVLRPITRMSPPSPHSYAYFVSRDRKIVIVDPATREVVRIVTR